MNALLGCSRGDVYQVTGFNVVRMQSPCPVCGRVLGLAEALGLVYGDTVRRIASDELSVLSRVSDRSNRDLSILIESVSNTIERGIKEHSKIQ